MKLLFRFAALVLGTLFVTLFVTLAPTVAPTVARAEPHIAVIEMDMMLLPGTDAYLARAIETAHREGAKALIVTLDTPGGVLQTTQDMVQRIFESPIPVVIYVTPTGATATSAGVFLTMAGHVAAMAPGTSIGAAHPVASDGKDIEGDMRSKAENMAVAMVRSISEQRGRDTEWVTKAVRESSSITAQEALERKVIDMVTPNIDALIAALEGREVTVSQKKITLSDLRTLPVKAIPISSKESAINVLSNPTIAALLWVGATTGLTIELYNPGAILPGVVGVICLILALAVNQVIPLTQGGVLLIVSGTLMMASELFIPSGILGVGGLAAILLGAYYLVDLSAAPGLGVDMAVFVPIAIGIGALLLWFVYALARSRRAPSITGAAGMVGARGEALESFATQGQIMVQGEVWRAVPTEGAIAKGDSVEVVRVREGLTLEVQRRELE